MIFYQKGDESMKWGTFIKVSAVVVLIVCLGAYSAQAMDKIASISAVSRLIQADDKINIVAIDDPDNPFITCYLSDISSGKILAIADPSNNSIACRLTGTIPINDKGMQVIVTKDENDIYSKDKSWLSKELKIARHYDPKRNVMIYTSYVTKFVGGSIKHSLSVVPLGDIK